MTIDEFIERYRRVILSGTILGGVTGCIWLCEGWVVGLLFLILSSIIVEFFFAWRKKRSREVRL